MNNIKYFLQFICVIILFGIFKIIGLKYSRLFAGKIMTLFGPIFRSEEIIFKNLSRAFPNIDQIEKKKILKKMWFNYGRIFAEYMFIKNFRQDPTISKNILIDNRNILEDVKRNSEPVIFISGHFDNFELMAMQIEKEGIDLAVMYRPLNNNFLNPLMEKIRKKFICKKQIKKGISGTKELLINFKKGTSIALMIDQRVSQGIRADLFGEKALTTTIPAQFIRKFNIKVIPVSIERKNIEIFRITFHPPIGFPKNSSVEFITSELNKFLENMIKNNPDQWIWSHNRWK
tara:strand:- start:2631 stop:3494 length:864 start_codon:yes stop_codon:yes gene_type:complete